MTAAQIQNALVVCTILGFAMMEFVSRRYKHNVNATSNDTKLEVLMFLSVLAVTQPLAILVTSKLGSAFSLNTKAFWPTCLGGPWWACC